jgi:hypothetical protein
VLALACAGSLGEVAHLLILLRGDDTRRLAADWIQAHLDDDAAIGWLGSHYGRPPIPQSPESLGRRLAGARQDGSSGLLLRKRVELARRGSHPRYLVIDLCRDPAGWSDPLPEYLLVERYPLFYTRKETAFADAWIRQGGYRELRRWRVTDPGREIPASDPQDAVYLPYGHLDRVHHSGPELILYRCTEAQGARTPRANPRSPPGGGSVDPQA